jgi:hypothetical protein
MTHSVLRLQQARSALRVILGSSEGMTYPALRPRPNPIVRFFRLSAMFPGNSGSVCAASGGFGFARNTAATFDIL